LPAFPKRIKHVDIWELQDSKLEETQEEVATEVGKPGLLIMQRTFFIACVLAAIASAQPLRRFDVVSVKQLPSTISIPDANFHETATSVTTTATLNLLLYRAFAPIRSTRISGLPAWGSSVFYDIRAKAETPFRDEEMRSMLQALLADRFGLKVHWETREIAYATLVVVAGGVKLKPLGSDTDDRSPVNNMIRLRNLHELADALSTWMGITVTDETHIYGDFDITIDLRNESYRGPDGRNPRGIDLVRATGDAMVRHLSEFGIKLERRKGPIEILVVDQALRPSEN
jgi:uncharacterized protein (TIGR03435 family)